VTVSDLRARQIAAAELLCGAAIVIAHNVYRLLPNEVPILVVVALLSMRLHRGRWDWSALGFRRPDSWLRIVAIALAATAVRHALGTWVIDPATEHFWPPAKAPSGSQGITGNLRLLLLYLPLIWGFAAGGEEIAYRGYLLGRAAAVGGGGRLAWWAAVLVSAVLFGFGHYYKGPSGMVDSGFAGLVLGIAYLWSGRNLWTCVLAHGFMDTVALIAVYLGVND
jgi:membrane protease YdiL (CAAX protease family)